MDKSRNRRIAGRRSLDGHVEILYHPPEFIELPAHERGVGLRRAADRFLRFVSNTAAAARVSAETCALFVLCASLEDDASAGKLRKCPYYCAVSKKTPRRSGASSNNERHKGSQTNAGALGLEQV